MPEESEISSNEVASTSGANKSSPYPEVGWKAKYHSRLWNQDLGPLLVRTWGAYNIFAFWMSDVHSVGGYTTSGSLFVLGISCWQVLLAHMIGICIVMLLCNLVAKPSVVTGCPFPVMARMAFGVKGANIPAVIRGIQSIPYYGINTWMASNSLLVPVLKLFPGLKPYADASQHGFLDLSLVGWGAFIFMWTVQALIFFRGIDAIRKFIDLAGPAVYLTMIMLAAYLCYMAGGISFSIDPEYTKEPKEGTASLIATIQAVAIIVSFFAGPMLNFGDFARYATTTGAVKKGNFLGCPINFLFFALLVVITTAATPKVFGELVDDPIKIVDKIDSYAAAVLGALTFSIATMGINIVANFLSPCFDFANVDPERISMQMGGAIAAVGSVLCVPWKLYNNPEIIHYTLGALGSFIGPLMGIQIAEYYVVRKQQVVLDDLFSMSPSGTYWYRDGYNLVAIGVLVPSIIMPLCCVLLKPLHFLNDYAYFVGLGMAFFLYSICSQGRVLKTAGVIPDSEDEIEYGVNVAEENPRHSS
mmetsp:Transcript_74639/g.194079  ORF Transcript_74639/g.194079 Transcript_74639/m.194079 type:complete len:530 (+) Transcript_74639:74-1663(+)